MLNRIADFCTRKFSVDGTCNTVIVHLGATSAARLMGELLPSSQQNMC